MNPIQPLVVSDAQDVSDTVTAALLSAGYLPLLARNAEECFQVMQEEIPDIVILDAELPMISGIHVAAMIRKDSNVPMIILAACDEEMECVRSLEIGAEDCVTKPIRPREFLLRVRNVLARHGKSVIENRERVALPYLQPIYQGEFIIDPNRYEIKVRGTNIAMPPLQFKLLFFLASHPDRVMSYSTLLEKVWEEPYSKS